MFLQGGLGEITSHPSPDLDLLCVLCVSVVNSVRNGGEENEKPEAENRKPKTGQWVWAAALTGFGSPVSCFRFSILG